MPEALHEALSQGVLRMRTSSGFTIMELMFVLAIGAIVASIAVPSFSSWRSRAKLNYAARVLRGDLEMAKSRAMRENNFVALKFVDANSYQVFIDDGAGDGDPGDWILHADEQLILNRKLPPGTTINLGATTFPGDQNRFNGRGRIRYQGSVIIENSSGVQKKIDIDNRFGRIKIN